MPLNTVAPATFNTTNTLGIDVTETFQVPSSTAVQSAIAYPQSDYANPKFSPGQIVMAGNGATYTWAQVTSVGSINKGDFVAFVTSAASVWVVAQLTSTLAATGPRIGISQNAQPVTTSTFTQFCWILTSGDGIGNLIGSIGSAASAGLPLFVSSVAGCVTSASTSTYLVTGLVTTGQVTGAASAGASNFNIIANQMMVAQPTSTSGTGFAGPF